LPEKTIQTRLTMAKTIQDQLAEAIQGKYPDAEVKKVNKDNFLDIHIPGIHPKRGTHLFFNTSGGAIKLGFYCREEDFTQKILAKNKDLEVYSQGIRPKGNPEWKSVDPACTAAFAFVDSLSGKGKKEQTTPTKKAPKPKKEKPGLRSSKTEEFSDFDLTEFDLEGRAMGRKDPAAHSEEDEIRLAEIIKQLESQMETEEEAIPAAKLPKGKPADTSLADETDRCLDDPMVFLTCVQQLRNYYLGLSPKSSTYRATYEEILREFTKAAIVPRITNDMLRRAHEEGALIESLLLLPMLKAEDTYDKNYETHDDYVQSLGEVVSDLLGYCNVGLFLDTLEFFMYLGDELDEDDSPNGSLTVQDRYFPLFLMLKASPEQNPENLEMVLDKGAKSRNASNGCDVKALLLKASGNFNQLSNEEKLALVLYDFILWDEGPGLDIKIEDIKAAQNIFKVAQNIFKGQTAKSPVSEKLIGGFKDNASYEIFQFFNVEFNREGFHEFCLARWKEFLMECELGWLKWLVYRVSEDFHPNTYRNNPVLEEYLEIYEGFRKTMGYHPNLIIKSLVDYIKPENQDETKAEEKAEEKTEKPEAEEEEEDFELDELPYSIDEVNKTVKMSVFHQILFLILYVSGKTENHTKEEIADVTSTATSICEWFDKDEDEGWDVLEETFEILQKCGVLFTLEELADFADECCYSIHEDVSNPDAQKDIIRFITDQANADGELDLFEEENIRSWSLYITVGRWI